MVCKPREKILKDAVADEMVRKAAPAVEALG